MAIALGLVMATVLVHQTGGTRYAYPYLLLLPIIFAGAVFKVPGGLIAAAAAGLALGPWMPLDVTIGTMQTTEDWLVRMGMYAVIGGFSGALSTMLFAYQQEALIKERRDPVSGLIAPMVAERLRPGRDTRETIGFEPAFAVVIAFEGLETVLRMMGLEASNRAIFQFAHVLTEAIGDRALVTRIHGSTFGILLPPGRRNFSLIAERMKKSMPDAIEIDNCSIILMLRVGIGRIDESDRFYGQPFRKPLAALHLARFRGHRVARYNRSIDRQAQENLSLIGEFSEALQQERLSVHFQPKVDMATGHVFAAEALVRWWSDTRGFVPPGRFIPLIEHTTLIDPMTRFVAEQSVRMSAEWRAGGLNIDVALNICPSLLRSRDFLSFLEQLPGRYGVPASTIEIEITETALMDDIVAMRRTLERLCAHGFLIAIDDYGTGYASLKYLKELPVNWVKLDQSFVRDLPGNEASCEISAATAAMCKRLNYKVIAEGVETSDSLEFLRAQGFDAVQGYHHAKPMPPEEFLDWASGNLAAMENPRPAVPA